VLRELFLAETGFGYGFAAAFGNKYRCNSAD
jgi:hypothetical protein